MAFMENLQPMGQQNPIKVLEDLLDKTNIALKTDLRRQDIKVLVRLRWFRLLREEYKKPVHERKEVMQLVEECMVYTQELLCSLERKREAAIVQGITQIRDNYIPDLPGQQQGLRK